VEKYSDTKTIDRFDALAWENAQVAMSKANRPTEIANCALDAGALELPSGGVLLKACSFRSVNLAGIPIPVFIARGCSFDSCNLTGTWLGAGYFRGGEAAGFSQTVYHVISAV
jgi:hypothetical protein